MEWGSDEMDFRFQISFLWGRVGTVGWAEADFWAERRCCDTRGRPGDAQHPPTPIYCLWINRFLNSDCSLFRFPRRWSFLLVSRPQQWLLCLHSIALHLLPHLVSPLNKEDKESKKDDDWFADRILRVRSPLKLWAFKYNEVWARQTWERRPLQSQ